MTQLSLSTRLTPLLMMLLTLFALTMQGCNGGDGWDLSGNIVVSDADPAGYYINTGDVQGESIAVSDLQAMVNGTRIMMMSVDNGLLYDGTITNINGNDFTADFIIYIDGENPVTATASGTITTGSSITGTLDGSGVGSGTFSLLYASTNNQAAVVALAWLGFGAGFDSFGFTINGVGNLIHSESAGFGSFFFQCKMSGTITLVSGTRLYSVDVGLTDCDDLSVNGPYTGLATTRDESAMDDRLVYAVSNDTYTLSGEFSPD